MQIKRSFTKGFSVLEAVVVVGIFSIISVGTTWLVISSHRDTAIMWEQLATQGEGRRVLERITSELRKAEISSIGSYPIVVAENNQIIFFSNIDSDILREQVRYWVSGTTLYKGVIKPSGDPISYAHAETITEVAHHVKNLEQNVPVFEYYNESFSGTQPPLSQPVNITDVRVIRVQLELEKDPNQSPVPLHVESVVQVRNLKSN